MTEEGRLRAADKLLAPAVERTLTALELTDADAAAVKLAQRYAAAIDGQGTEALDKMGPKLLATLDALGATPAARAKRHHGGGVHAGESKLAKLREARRPA